MYRSMYELLNKSIDYRNEYEKLLNMIFTEHYYKYNSCHYTFIEIFDKFLVNWKYKGTKCNSSKIIEELGIEEFPSVSAEESCLKL